MATLVAEELPRPDEYLPELAGLLLSEETVSGLLEMVVNLAVSAVAGVDGASVSLRTSHGARLETTNASSELIRTIDEAQYQHEAGPCVQAIRSGTEVTFHTASGQWPEFAHAAAAAGVTTVWSLPLRIRDQTTGALNLYSTTEVPPDEPDTRRTARALAAQAAVVLANATALMTAELVGAHLQEALAGRDLIGQAKGILMTRQAISSDEAFDILRRASQRNGHKLRDVAAEIVRQLGQPDNRT